MNANLLLDNVFGIELPSGERRSLSLPALLAALGRGDVESLTGVQRHQADAFHIFLCYLAGAVLDQAAENSPIQDEAFWRDGIRRLTGRDDDDAWTLVVDDPTRPAFMQPPVTDPNDLKLFKADTTTPDELDILQTARNHDLKSARSINPITEAWALALISMQTMSGYGGSGNYGICRMYGGYGSRTCVTVVSDLQPALRWQQDCSRLLTLMVQLLRPRRPFNKSGYVLLWLIPWDGKTGMGLDQLHPYFIEVSRRVRLVCPKNEIFALRSTSKCARITVPKEVGGNVGDPWTPVSRDGGTALSLSKRGFDPYLLSDLIVKNKIHAPSAMQGLQRHSGPAWFHASGLARGKTPPTDGYHEQRIYIEPKPLKLLLAGGKSRDRLGLLSDWALTQAVSIRGMLHRAVFTLIEGGPESGPKMKRREIGQWVSSWLNRFDAQWAVPYFPWLWSTIEQTNAEAREKWLQLLKALADQVLDEALRNAPQRTGRRYRGKVRANGLFHSAFQKHFKEEITDVAG